VNDGNSNDAQRGEASTDRSTGLPPACHLCHFYADTGDAPRRRSTVACCWSAHLHAYVFREDSTAEVDMNVVMTDDGRFVEVQGTAEGAAFSAAQMADMLLLARRGIDRLIARQKSEFPHWP